MLSDDIQTSWKNQLDSLLSEKKQDDIDRIFNIFEVVLELNSGSDMADLFKLVGLDAFSKIVNHFDGRKINFYKISEFKEALILALLYYYKEHLNLSWKEINERLPFKISPYKYGLRIKQLNKNIVNKLNVLFEQLGV